jgi:hypothetical protein
MTSFYSKTNGPGWRGVGLASLSQIAYRVVGEPGSINVRG